MLLGLKSLTCAFGVNLEKDYLLSYCQTTLKIHGNCMILSYKYTCFFVFPLDSEHMWYAEMICFSVEHEHQLPEGFICVGYYCLSCNPSGVGSF